MVERVTDVRTIVVSNGGPSPANGAIVTAGSTITVSAIGSEGFTIARALVSSAVFSSDDDQDAGSGFTTTVTPPPDFFGALTIRLLANDANSNLKSAPPVTVSVVLPGNVTLVRLESEKATLLLRDAEPAATRKAGIYSDGIRREVTRMPGILTRWRRQDPRSPWSDPYNGTGVATRLAGRGLWSRPPKREAARCATSRTPVAASTSWSR
jgi:hypothetical protein